MTDTRPEQNMINLVKFMGSTFGIANVSHIVELGARDCKETLWLNKYFPKANILSFECNPSKLEECRARVSRFANIKLVEKAVSDTSGTVSFFQIDPEKTITDWEDGNPGASSLYKASVEYELEKYVQKEITVPCTTLHEELPQHNFDKIDLLWMDIQGSELNAVKGLKEKLSDVHIIHTEVEFMAIYEGQPLFWDLKKFLNDRGFKLASFTSFHKNKAGDAIFINTAKMGLLKRLKYYITNRTLYLLYHYKVLSL